MSASFSRIWKSAWTAVLAVGVAVMSLFPYRALMNYHEQTHMFRWSGYYLREQWSSLEGVGEYVLSFITQFFYVGWLGAAVLAVIAVALQLLVWLLFKLCRLRQAWAYPLTLIPSLLVLYLVFVPSAFRTDGEFREMVTYDYLVRAQRWNSVLARSYHHEPQTMCGVWCTNYALAKKGRLLNDMFLYKQDGPDGLLMDAVRMPPMSLYSLSDISMDLGMINSAERFAFDAKQRLPHGNKSGRLYKRLAEANLANGYYKVARKYLHALQSTLFYSAWANRQMTLLGHEAAVNGDKTYAQYRSFRQKDNDELAYAKDQMLSQLVAESPKNKLAADYLLALEMLRLDLEHVTIYTQMLRQRDNWQYTPKAIQESVAGYWILSHPNDSLPFPINENIFRNTVVFLQTVNSSGNVLTPSLDVPPHNQSYWHYHTQALAKLKKLRP